MSKYVWSMCIGVMKLPILKSSLLKWIKMSKLYYILLNLNLYYTIACIGIKGFKDRLK